MMLTWILSIFLASVAAVHSLNHPDHDGNDTHSVGQQSPFAELMNRNYPQAFVQCQSTGEGCGNSNRCCSSVCRAVKGNNRQCCLSQGLVCDAAGKSPGLATCCQGLTCKATKFLPKSLKITVCDL